MQYKYCEHCGKKIKINSKFCPFCGTKQISHINTQSNSHPSSNSSNSNPNSDSVNSNTTRESNNKSNNIPHMSRVEMHEKQNQSNQNFDIDKYKNKAQDYEKHLKSGFDNYLNKRGYNGNNMDDVVRSLWKPFKQHDIFLIYPAVISIFYLIEFMMAVDYATGGNVDIDLSNSAMATFPISARFGVILMGSVPVIISIVLACLPWFWSQVIAIIPFLFGTTALMSETHAGSNALCDFALIIMIVLLIYSRLSPQKLYGDNYLMYENIKKWTTRGLIVLAGILFIVSLKAFYLLIKPELFGTLAVIILFLVLGAFPTIQYGWYDVFGIFHRIF